jgi:hypothetical protein
MKRPWRPYDDAVAFVHALVLKRRLDWAAYCRGERRDLPVKPADIPADPPSPYGPEFGDRDGWGAWLGTGTVATFNRPYRPYPEAVAFVHALALKARSDWDAYCRGERGDLPAKPADIPANPRSVYGNEFRERGGWGRG